ncbi:hypothetical protein DENSPDRAFT_840457 [Dentipellis sp. KUC8613]|nr:hypothetical protein DENSPDRAFT_840457 [Dentipellis sp. KUC8613]
MAVSHPLGGLLVIDWHSLPPGTCSIVSNTVREFVQSFPINTIGLLWTTPQAAEGRPG